MLDILITVIPVFLVIGAGFAATRTQLFSMDAVNGLIAFTQNFAIPCLLFAAMARLDLSRVFDPGLLISFYGGATASFLLGIAGAKLIFNRRPGEAVSIGFGALLSNTVLLGLPITERAFGPDALAPNFAIIAIHAPYCYLLGITFMEFARSDGRGLVETLQAVSRAMFRNALMIGLGLGLIVNLARFPLTEPVWAAIDMMADTALPAALFGMGGVLTQYRLNASLGEAGMVSFLSLVVHPAIVLTLGTLVFDLTEGFLISAVITAAMAPGVNSYVFANMYDRAKDVAASTVLLATVTSVLTANLWLYLLRHLEALTAWH